MVSIVARKHRSAQDKEVVVMLSDHQDASASYSIDIPDIIIGVNFDPSIINGKVQLRESANHEAINEGHTLPGVVLLLSWCEPNLPHESFELALGYNDVGTARVKDCNHIILVVVINIEGVIIWTKSDSLNKVWPIKVGEHGQSLLLKEASGWRAVLSAFHWGAKIDVAIVGLAVHC